MKFILLLILFSALIQGCVTPDTKKKSHENLSQWSLGDSKQFVLVKESQKDLPVIVFVHGGPGNPLTPYAHKIDPVFLTNFNVVHWDQRGSGLSFEHTRDMTLAIDRYVDDLQELLKQVKNKFPHNRIVLVGASWGSLIAIKVANQYPTLADYYVGVGQMIEPLAGLNQTYLKLLRAGTSGIKEVGRPPWDTNHFFRFVGIATKSENYKNKIDPDDLNKIAAESPYYQKKDMSVIEEGQVLSITRLIQEIYKFNAPKEIRDLKIPALFLQGDQDWITPTNLVTKFVEANNSSKKMELIQMKGFGHNLLLETPSSVEEAIIGFL